MKNQGIQQDNVISHSSNSKDNINNIITATSNNINININNRNSNNDDKSLDFLSNLGKSLEYSVETNIDYGYGNIDVVWNVSLHPLLPQIKLEFIKLESNEDGGRTNLEDNQ